MKEVSWIDVIPDDDWMKICDIGLDDVFFKIEKKVRSRKLFIEDY
jgi:hypothetical protein